MKQRKTVRKLRDLLPDVLIEAQGCDEITATAALRRSVEELCFKYGFGEQELWVTIGNSYEPPEEDYPHAEVLIPISRQNVLRILRVESHGRALCRWQYDGTAGMLKIARGELPEHLEHNGHCTGVKITAEIMPDVDEEIQDIDNFTKYRTLIVAMVLEDLFAMVGQVWSSGDRYTIYRERARRYLEQYLTVEKFYQGDGRAPRASVCTCGNVFC